jgi:mono/diheme cytochrome c family protein
MRLLNMILPLLIALGLTGCMEQYNPRGDWALFKKERETAHAERIELGDDGSMPDINKIRAEAAAALAASGTDGGIGQKYTMFCVSCHGENGDGNGPAGVALMPKPRNFKDVAWWESGNGADKERLYAVLKLGGGGTDYGVAATMAAWGGVLDDDQIKEMIAYLETTFKGK